MLAGRKTLLMLGAAALAVVGVGQVRGLDLLKEFAMAINQAKTLKATYTVTPLAGVPVEYSVELSKPNLARIEGPEQLLIANGQELISYDKASKVYTKLPIQEGAGKFALGRTPFTAIWSGFFDVNAFNRTVNPIYTGQHKRKGQTLEGVKYSAGVEHANISTLYFDKGGARLFRQGEFDLVGPQDRTKYLLDTSSVEINADIPADRFAWEPPQDAREVTAAEMAGAGWFTNLHAAVEAAKRSKRLIFLDFYADW